MLNRTREQLKNYFEQLQAINLLEFNKFIFQRLILHLFKTENILPFLIAACIIGFSVLVQASRFIFIPQTSVAAFASFFIFTVVISVLTLVIYPVFIIILVNFLSSYITSTATLKFSLKFSSLLLSFILGVTYFTGQVISTTIKLEIIVLWLGLYFILTSLYLTHLQHNTLLTWSKTKIIFGLFIIIIMSRPLILIFLHTSEALNFTNINPQVYLPAPMCALLHNLDGQAELPKPNNIFYNNQYYAELPKQQGCYIYNNTIRYSFAYDFVLMVKKNINPIIGKTGIKYNEYVRLSCYANNCYSENYIYFKDSNDLNNDLIKKGSKLEHPF